MKHSPRCNEESGSESAKIQKPGCVIPGAAARNFPCRNLSLAWPIRSVLGCDVMQIVQTRRRHARRPVGEINRDWSGLDAHPTIAIAAVRAEFGISKKQSPSRAQRKIVRIPSHRSGELTVHALISMLPIARASMSRFLLGKTAQYALHDRVR